MQAALLLCIATEIRCRRNWVDPGSAFTTDTRRPSSLIKFDPSSPQTPVVSIATGTKSMLLGRSAYLLCLFSSAEAAAAPTVRQVALIWDWAYVSGQVASQARHLPFFHGTDVTPTGRFPLCVMRPVGSRVERTPAEINALSRISFISLWRDWRPALLRQDRPWRPSADTMVSQTHLCGRTKGAPRRRPAAMRTDASSSLRPIPGRGRALSQSPDPQALDASR